MGRSVETIRLVSGNDEIAGAVDRAPCDACTRDNGNRNHVIGDSPFGALRLDLFPGPSSGKLNISWSIHGLVPLGRMPAATGGF